MVDDPELVGVIARGGHFGGRFHQEASTQT
jgi:hypothetical protein